MRTKFFLILYTGVARGSLLWCRGDVPGKSQEQQQLVAVQHNPFLYPMKSINKHHWEPEIWLPQLHFLFWLLAHGSDRAALWLGPYGRFLRAKIFSVIGSLRKEAAEVRMQWRNWMQKKKKMGLCRGEEWEVGVLQQCLYTGTGIWWTDSSGRVMGASCCKEGKKILLGFCPLTESQVVSKCIAIPGES